MEKINCSVEKCTALIVNKRGWCRAHYMRWLRHGDPLAGGTPMRAAKRYFEEVATAYDGDECLTWPYMKTAQGYGLLSGSGRTRLVSRLVCEAVHGPAPSILHQAAHLCGKGHLGCVAKRHLAWKTRTENEADKIAHGTRPRGALVNGARLTEADVLEIRAQRGLALQRDLAAKFGVSKSHITSIQLGTTWGLRPEPKSFERQNHEQTRMD